MHLAEEFSQHVHEAEEGVSLHAHQYLEERYSLDHHGNGLQSKALKTQGWTLKYWKQWLSWATRCRLEPINKLPRLSKCTCGESLLRSF